MEGVEVGGLLDTCLPYLFISEKIFSELEGRKVREPIKYKGVGGKVRVQEWGKKVSVVVPWIQRSQFPCAVRCWRSLLV